jgi:hypothetical protein
MVSSKQEERRNIEQEKDEALGCVNYIGERKLKVCGLELIVP